MNMTKVCEVCGIDLPEDFQNALCPEHYEKQVKENLQALAREKNERKAMGKAEVEDIHKADAQEHIPVKGIADPSYKTNPQQDEIPMAQRNAAQFFKSGHWLWMPTRSMYTFIKDSFRDIVVNHLQYPKFIWKPTVIDIGCGSGCGTNILSQEADFAWGVDKCEQSVALARELFGRLKNNIYYTPEIRFDVIDVENPPPNIDMKFDTVVAIEIFEHLEDHEALLNLMKSVSHEGIKKGNREAKRSTDFWISTPNRNNKHISDAKPTNKYHVKELSSEEFAAVLTKHFGEVKLFNSAGVPIEGYSTTHTPLLALAKNPI